jgi:hypothetical protein
MTFAAVSGRLSLKGNLLSIPVLPVSNATPTLEHQVILCLSDSFWHSGISGRQQVMSRLARGNTVLYVDPPPHLETVWRRRTPATALTSETAPRTGETLQIVRFPKWLGYTYRPRLEQFLVRFRVMFLKRALRRFRHATPIFYVWHPSAWPIVRWFPKAFVCYHVYDDYASYTGADRAAVTELDAAMSARADVLIGVTEALVASRRQIAPDAHVVYNGGDYAAFADQQRPEPSELAGIPRPRIVSVARLNQQVDFERSSTSRNTAAVNSFWSDLFVVCRRRNLRRRNEFSRCPTFTGLANAIRQTYPATFSIVMRA